MKKITLLFFMLFVSLYSNAQLPPEGFEDGFPPVGWGIYNNGIGLNVNWALNNNTPAQPSHSGTHAAYLNKENVSSGIPADWLITKAFTVPVNPQLRFWSRLTQGGNQGSIYQVWISTNTAPGQQGVFSNYTLLQTWTETEINPAQEQYIEKVLTLPNVGQEVFVAFVMLGDNADRWLIDDVSVTEKCLEPTNLTATNIGTTSANLSWANPSGATNFEIEIIPATASPVGVGVPATGGPSYVATNLTPSTCYKYFVRALCPTTNISQWVGPYNFCTVAVGATCAAPIVITIPYSATSNTNLYGDDFDGAPGATGCGTTSPTFLNGDEVVYAYTANFTGQINVNMYGTGPNAGVFVYNSCASIGVSCVAGGVGNATVPVNLAAVPVTSGTTYYIVISTSGTTQSTPYSIAVQPVSCNPPTGLSAPTVGSSSANLSWNALTYTSWEVAVQYAGSGLPAGPGVTTTTNTNYLVTQTNSGDAIDQATSYEYYVRADCGNGTFSAWAGPFLFNTIQIPAALNYTQDFETAPAGFSLSNGNQANKWVVGTAVNNGGTHALYISNDNGINNAYTVTTASTVHAYRDIQMPATLNELALSFDWKSAGETGFDQLKVWLVPVTFTPTPGTAITAAGGRIQIGGIYSASNTWTTATTVFNAASSAGLVRRLIFEWRNDNQQGIQPPAAIDNINLSVITCSAPTALTLVSVAQSQAVISWTAPGTPASSYEYYITTTNTAPVAGTAPTSSVPGTTATITNLTPSTTYYVWVRANCGDANGVSFWTGPLVFNTPQIPGNLDYTQDFEAANISWTFNNGTQTNKWVLGTAVNNGGTHSLYVSRDNGTTNTYNNAVISVVQAYRDLLIPADAAEIGISFDWKSVGEGNYDNMRVWMVPVTYTPVPGTAITAGGGRVQIGGNFSASPNWSTYVNTYNATAFQGQVRRFIFEWKNDDIFGGPIAAAVDNLNIKVITCSRPAVLTATNITTTGATLGWTPATAGQQFEVAVLPYGSAAPAGAGTPVTENSYTVTGLQSGTCYVFYVRANCGPVNGLSYWAGPFSFCTQITNDNCPTAIPVPVNAGTTCIQSVSGTLTGSTVSGPVPSCLAFGTVVRDVWYSFVATAQTHVVSINNPLGGFYNFVVYSGACGALTEINCEPYETAASVSGLTVGNTYYVKIYSTAVPEPISSFSVCVITPLVITANNTQYTVPQLVSEVLVTSTCAQVSNTTWRTGNTNGFNSFNGIAQFTSGNSNFPIPKGVILSTGNALKAVGPNLSNLSDGGQDFPITWTGDTQLYNYITGLNIDPFLTSYNNASVLEFDFVPLTGHISFPFVFASEEYGTYQCTFSDAFAFFLTDSEGNTINLALLEGTNTPISVVTIRDNANNNGCASANVDQFGEYYGEEGTGLSPLDAPINFNGVTEYLLAQADVNIGEQYHIKLVIADRNDGSFDSAVFIGPFDIGDIDLGVDLTVETENAVCEGETITLHSGLDPALYTFQWSLGTDILEGETGADINITVPGTYTILASYISSTCTGSDSILVEFYDPINDITGEPIDLTHCDASGFALFDLSQNTGIILEGLNADDYTVSYHLSEDDALQNANPLPLSYTNVTQTLQTIYIRIYNAVTGCTGTKQFDLKVQDLTPQFDLTDDVIICEGTETTLTVTPGNYEPGDEDVTYIWKKGDEVIAGTSGSITVSEAGIYKVTVDNAGCSASATVTVTVIPAPVAVEVADVTRCDSYTLEELAPGNVYYTGSNATGEILAAGTIINASQVIYVYAAGPTASCNNETSFNVAINTTPVVSTPGNVTACSVYSLPALETGNYFTETGGGGTMLNANDPITTTQLIYVYAETATTPNCSNEDSFTVTIVTPPAAAEVADVTRCDSYTLEELAPGNVYYTGSNATGDILPVGTVITASQTVYVFMEGPTAGCNNETSFNVVINTVPAIVTPGDITACSVYRLPALAVGNYFTQQNGGGTMLNENDPITTTQVIYIYAQTATVPNCSDEEAFTVTITVAPVADDPADVSECASYILPELNVGNYYTGMGGTGQQIAAGTSITTTTVLYVYASDGAECVSENVFTVNIKPLPQFNLGGPYVACSTETVTVSVNALNFNRADASYAWTFNGSPIAATTSSISPDAFGTYAVTVSLNGCTETHSVDVVQNTEDFDVAFDGDCTGGSYILEVSSVNDSFNPDTATYVWTSATVPGFSSTSQMPVITTAGFYTVTVTTPEGCTGSDTFEVPSTSCMLQKGISPNGDGKNDSFDLTALSVRQLSIFNRYGEEVYSKGDYTDQWHGQGKNDDELPTGTYFYMVERTNGESTTGWVYINREEN